MSASRMFLDVEPSLLESNLKILNETPEEDYMSQLFPEAPYKLCKPYPGFCLKMKNAVTNKKLFVNICQLDNIPAPADIKPEDVFNEDLQYRVPLSIGDLRYEMDKHGTETEVVDIALNSEYFQKVSAHDILTNFVIELAKDSLKEKYKLDIADEVVLLKNRKAFGELQLHRIRKQEIEEKMGIKPKKEPLVMDITGSKSQQKPRIEMMASSDHTMQTPEFRVFTQKLDPKTLVVEVKLPYVLSSKEFTLDLGEDRIVLESRVRNYFLDTFFPCLVDPDYTTAHFHKDSKVLVVKMKMI